MATLPTADSLPNVGVRSGREIAPAPTDFVGPAVANFGGAVAGLGQTLQQRANEQTSIERAHALAGFQIESLKIDDTYNVDKDADYGTYGARSKSDLDALQAKWANTITNPKQRDQFLTETSVDVTKNQLNIANRGAKQGRLKNLEDANTALDGLARAAISTNDPEAQAKSIHAAHDLIDSLESNKTITSSEATKWRRDSANQIAKLKYEADAVADPEGTLIRLGVPDPHAQDFLLNRLQPGKPAADITNMQPRLQGALAKMFADAPAQFKDGLQVISGARDNKEQQILWDQALKKYGSAEEARKWVAPPGSSQHEHGNAADVGYKGGGLGNAPPELITWLHDNASKYGLAFPLSNENWHVELADARSGGSAGATAPADTVDPMLSPEDVITLRAKARAQLSSQDQAARAAASAAAADTKDTYRLRIETGQLPDPNEFLNDNRIDNGDKATLMSAFNSANAEMRKTTAALGRVATGDSFTPFSSDDRADVGRVYDKLGGAGGLVEGDQKAAGRLSYVVDKTGVVPQGAIQALRGAMLGPDATQAANAYKVVGDLYSANNRIFDAYDGGSELRSAGEAYTHLTRDRGKSGADAVAQLQAANDPQNKRTVEQLKPAADEFVKSMNPDSVAAQFSGGIVGNLISGAITKGSTPEARGAFDADVSEIAREQFNKAHGDADVARSATVAEIKSMYDVDTTGGSPVLMRYAPKLRYPQINGGYDYLHDEAMKFAAEKTGLKVDDSLNPLGAQDAPTVARKDGNVASIALVSTRDTVADFKNGSHTPQYDVVVWKWQNGQRVLADLVHGFSVSPERLTELNKPTVDEAVRVHGVVRSNIDKADEALARRAANMYGGEPAYPDKSSPAPAPAPAPAPVPKQVAPPPPALPTAEPLPRAEPLPILPTAAPSRSSPRDKRPVR